MSVTGLLAATPAGLWLFPVSSASPSVGCMASGHVDSMNKVCSVALTTPWEKEKDGEELYLQMMGSYYLPAAHEQKP